MRSLKVGDRISNGPVQWEIIDRYQNFVFVKHASGGKTIYATSNIVIRDDSETFEPLITDNADSGAYDRPRIESFFNSEVERLKRREVSKAENLKVKEQEQKDQQFIASRADVLRKKRDDLYLKLKLIGKGRTADDLLSDPKVKGLNDELMLTENILKYAR